MSVQVFANGETGNIRSGYRQRVHIVGGGACVARSELIVFVEDVIEATTALMGEAGFLLRGDEEIGAGVRMRVKLN